MKPPKLIRDGMNKPFKIQPWGPTEETLEGRFRPMTSAGVEELRIAIAGDRGKRVEILSGALARHVLAWNIENEPPTPANIALLPAAFLDSLELTVTGYTASGADDDEKKS